MKWEEVPYQPRLPLSASYKTQEQINKEKAAKRKKNKKNRKLREPQPDRVKYITERKRQMPLDLIYPDSLHLPQDYDFVIQPKYEFDEYYGKYLRLGKRFRMRDLLTFFFEYDPDNSVLDLEEYVDYPFEENPENSNKLESETYMILGTLKHLLPDCVRKILLNHQEGSQTMKLSTEEMLRTLNSEFLPEDQISDESLGKNSDLYGLQGYFPSVSDGITSAAIKDFYSDLNLSAIEFEMRLEAIKMFISILSQEYPVENENMFVVRDVIAKNINDLLSAIEKLFRFFNLHQFSLDTKNYKVIFEKQSSLQLYFYDESRDMGLESPNRFYFDIFNEQLHVLSGIVNIRPDVVIRSRETGELIIYDFKSRIKDPNKLHHKLQAMMYLVAKSCERIWTSVSDNSKFGFVGKIPFSGKWFRDKLFEDCSRMRFFFVDLKTGEEHEMQFTREDFEELYLRARRYLEVKTALSGKLDI